MNKHYTVDATLLYRLCLGVIRPEHPQAVEMSKEAMEAISLYDAEDRLRFLKTVYYTFREGCMLYLEGRVDSARLLGRKEYVLHTKDTKDTCVRAYVLDRFAGDVLVNTAFDRIVAKGLKDWDGFMREVGQHGLSNALAFLEETAYKVHIAESESSDDA